MSEDHDRESKTEEASEKRLHDAVERGERPISRDLTTLLLFMGLFFGLSFTWRAAVDRIGGILTRMLAACGRLTFNNSADFIVFVSNNLKFCFLALIPLIAIMVGAILAAPIIQGELRLASERITPKLDRIDPIKGFARVFSKRGFVEFLKSTLKLSICAIVIGMTIKSRAYDILDAMMAEPATLGALIIQICLEALTALAGVMIAISIFDFLFVRFSWRKSLRMTKQEVKDEMKQSEGDPYVKARLRGLAMDRARRRMLKDVERATLVIANPVHYAVALRYIRDEGGAPAVLAKGQELIALKIRERAEQLGIPVIENPPLARSMYDHVEVGQMIPQQFYRAIAEIINYLATGKRTHGALV